MKNIYLVIRHPRNYRYLGVVQISRFYEIVKSVESRKEAKEFCDNKNKNSNTEYHYAVKILRVE